MKTLTYIIEASADFDLAYNLITEKIPCFATWKPFGDDGEYIEVCFTCRQEDAAFVEEMLAPFV